MAAVVKDQGKCSFSCKYLRFFYVPAQTSLTYVKECSVKVQSKPDVDGVGNRMECNRNIGFLGVKSSLGSFQSYCCPLDKK